MSQNLELHLIAYDEASNVFQAVGSNVSSVFTDIEGRTQALATTTDSATSQISLDYDDVQFSMKALEEAQGSAQMSTKDTVMSMNNLALSGASLVMSFERVEKSQIMVDRANLMVQRSIEAVEKAQKGYNDAVAKYGSNSAEAKDALDKLNIAQEAHNVALERASMALNNLNMSMVTSALMVIPSFVSIIGSIPKLYQAWTGEQLTLNAAMLTNPILIVVAAIAAMAAIFVYAYSTCEPFRNALNALGGYIGGAFLTAINAVSDAIHAVGNLFSDISSAISNAVGGFVGWVTGANQTTKATTDLSATVKQSTEAITQLSLAQQFAEKSAKDMSVAMDADSKAVQFHTDTLEEALHKGAQFSMDQGVWAAHQKEMALETSSTFDELRTSMETSYDKMRAAADASLPSMVRNFREAFNAHDFTTAMGLVSDFADEYGLKLMDVENMFESMAAKLADLPKSIEEQLIGKAQADLQTFKDCATGKFAGLQDDTSASMKQLVTDTNDLISSGLVGQAQDNIKVYVDCATDKHAQLVSNIDADLAKLRTDYAAGADAVAPFIKQLEEWKVAATLGPGGSSILDAIKLGNMTANEVAGQTETATTKMAQSFKFSTEQIQAHAERLEDSLVGRSIWTDMLVKMESTTEKSVAKIRGHFQMLQPEGIMGGGFGVPEALPGAGGKAPVIQPIINITIEGNADRATVELTKKAVLDALKTVIVEPTSISAPSTSKRIRKGAVFG